MANLDNLNFQVILKSDEFEKQIKRVQALADEFNISMSAALSLTSAKEGAKNLAKIVSGLKQAKTAQKDLNDEIRKSPAEKITIKHGQAVKATNGKLYDTARILRTIGTLTGGAFSVYGLRRFLSTLIEVTGQFEVQKMALRTMLQDIDAADKIFQDLYRFSSDSTYRFSELAKYSKQLAAFNIGKDSLLETTKMLGDVASGVGVSMDRIILAYGHVKSSGFLRGIQLRSFSQNGVPILDELAKMFTELEGHAVSLGEVFDKMTKREIPFEMVEEAFRRMTSEGGKFYQMQEVLSKTLAGQINILKGRWENLMYAIGQSQDGILKGTVSSISKLIANYEEFGKLLRQIITAFTIYKATIIGVEVATNAFSFANHKVLNSLKNLVLWATKNPYAILAAALAAATVVAVRYMNQLSDTEKITKALDDATKKYDSSVSSEIRELDLLYGALKSAKEGTQEYDSAKRAIQKRFDPYIQQLRNEGVAVGDLATVYDHLAEKIRNASKERFLEEAQSNISTAYHDAEKRADDTLQNLISRMRNTVGNITPDEEGALRHYLWTGGKNDIFKSLENRLRSGQEKVNTLYYDAEGKAYNQTLLVSGEHLVDDLREARNQLDMASIAYEQAMIDAAKRFDAVNKAATGDEGDQMVYKISSVVEGIKKLDQEIEQIRSKAAKGSITEAEKTKLESLVQDREEQAKLYKSIMGVDYDKATSKGSKDADAQIKKEIQALNKQASILQKYKSAYDSLSPFLAEETTEKMAEIFGGKPDDYESIDEKVVDLIMHLRQLGEEGHQAADTIEAQFGVSAVAQLTKALQAAEKADEAFKRAEDDIKDYLAKDFSTGGDGAAHKIHEALRAWRNADTEVDQKIDKMMANLEKNQKEKVMGAWAETHPQASWDTDGRYQRYLAKEYWSQYKESRLKELKDQAKQEKALNAANTKEKIRGYAELIFNDQMGDYDLTNWNDKTIGQIQKIKDAIANVELDDEVKKELEDDVELAKVLVKELEKIKKKKTNQADNALQDEWAQKAKLVAKYLGKAAEYMEKLANATGSEAIGDLAVGLGALSENLQAAGAGYAAAASAGAGAYAWIGAVVGGVGDLTAKIIDSVAEATETSKREMEAYREYLRKAFSESLVEGVDTVFGDNLMRKLRNATNAIKSLNRIDAMENLTRKSGFLNLGRTKFTLEEASKNLNIPLYDELGRWNVELFRAIQNTYTLNDETARWVQDMIDNLEEYRETLKVFDEVMESVFGDVASQAAETIVNGWVEAGNAALDYADIIDNVAKSYAKMLIQSTILDSVFDDDEIKRIKAMFVGGDYQSAMSAIADDMQQITEMEPVFKQILEAFDPYFKRTDDNENTLSNGIKGITEDTASLLASYINAIRADVSMLRMLAQQGWTSVTHIASMLESLPTLNDYLANIAAHNANIEDNTRNILVELRGVIVNEGNGRGFRSYPA